MQKSQGGRATALIRRISALLGLEMTVMAITLMLGGCQYKIFSIFDRRCIAFVNALYLSMCVFNFIIYPPET
jgi:hypothetical protein